MTRLSAAFALLTLALAAACDTTVSPSDYDASCTVDEDCAFVIGGDVCSGCMTDIGAVNVDAADAFNADVDAIAGTCAPWSERYRVQCALGFPAVEPVCDAGQCTLRDQVTE